MKTIIVNSEKYGRQYIYFDEDDMREISKYALYVWGSKRHTGLYVMGYLIGGEYKTAVRMHRVIMNAKPGEVVDHINGNPLDNTKANLRVTTQKGNNCNAKKRRGTMTSHFKGVCIAPGGKRYKAQIQYNGKKMSLGTFDTPEEAAKAYNNAAIKYFKEFAVLNKV